MSRDQSETAPNPNRRIASIASEFMWLRRAALFVVLSLVAMTAPPVRGTCSHPSARTRNMIRTIGISSCNLLDAPVKRVAGVDVPLPYAANLEHAALPQPEWIVEAAKSVCYVTA